MTRNILNSEYQYFNLKQDPNIKGLDIKLMYMLDIAREFACIPFKITSGLRKADKNREIGGVWDSAHLTGLAVDIATKNHTTTFYIVKGLLSAGFKRIIIEKDHIHTDIDETKPQNILIYL